MKILVVGKRGGVLHWYESVVNALHSIEGIDVSTFPVNHGGWYQRARNKLVGKISPEGREINITNEFTKYFEKERPDLVFFVDLVNVPNGIYEFLRSENKSVPTGHWVGDKFGPELKKYSDIMDVYYFTDSYFLQLAKEYELGECRYLPLAYDATVFKYRGGYRLNKMVFVGARTANREEIIKGLAYPITIVGSHWKKFNSQMHDIVPNRVSLAEVNRLYNRHSAVLNMQNTHNLMHGLNMRAFDATACKCVLLNDDVKDLERCFDIGEEVLIYKSVGELNEIYSRLSKESKFAETIAECGYRRTVAHHSYEQRMRHVIRDYM